MRLPTLHSFFIENKHSATSNKPVFYRRRERMIRPGEDKQFVYYLVQGFIRQYLVSIEGTEYTVHIFGPGSIFPLLNNANHGLTEWHFETISPCEVHYGTKENFSSFIRDNSQALGEWIDCLNAFSGEIVTKLESKVLHDSHGQIIVALLELSKKFGKKRGNQIIIMYWFTHQDIAVLTGLSRERITIGIKKLIRKNLISYERHFIVIKNIELLKNELP